MHLKQAILSKIAAPPQDVANASPEQLAYKQRLIGLLPSAQGKRREMILSRLQQNFGWTPELAAKQESDAKAAAAAKAAADKKARYEARRVEAEQQGKQMSEEFNKAFGSTIADPLGVNAMADETDKQMREMWGAGTPAPAPAQSKPAPAPAKPAPAPAPTTPAPAAPAPAPKVETLHKAAMRRKIARSATLDFTRPDKMTGGLIGAGLGGISVPLALLLARRQK